jgi:putative nucleotidyltransferase with HDIG domain
VLRPVLFVKKQIVFGVVEGLLVFDGFPFYQTNAAIDEFIERLLNRGTKSLTMKTGMTGREILEFLALLLEDQKKIQEKGGMESSFKAAKIMNIIINEAPDEEDSVAKRRAKKVYTDARGIVLSIMSEARIGKLQSGEKAKQVVSSISDMLLKDANTLIGLTMIQDYDEYTFNHSVNVGILSMALAVRLKIGGQLLTDIGLAGLFHDIGKTMTPKTIINKPGKLNDDEWEQVKKHPVHSAGIIKNMEGIDQEVELIVLHHHTKYNLTGYPVLKNKAEQNPNSMVVAVADTYDSMTTLRPYQRRFDPKEAIDIMQKLAGRELDPQYVNEFTRMLGIYPVGTLVRLDTGEVAIVCEANAEEIDKPKVKILYNKTGEKIAEPVKVNLAEKDPATGGQKRAVVTTLDPMSKDLSLFEKI